MSIKIAVIKVRLTSQLIQPCQDESALINSAIDTDQIVAKRVAAENHAERGRSDRDDPKRIVVPDNKVNIDTMISSTVIICIEPPYANNYSIF